MKNIVIIILVLSGIYAQSIENIFTEKSVEPEEMIPLLNRDGIVTSTENITYTPVEKSVNPMNYILGPGDLLGINIISTEKISFQIRINPVGEIMIPMVGVLSISGSTLAEARIAISNFVKSTALQNAIVSTTLLDIRRFKIQILGAVNNPGFIEITPVDRVYDAILLAKGVQKYAHPDTVNIIRDENTITIILREYLSGNDLSQNILLKEGDVIFVPFNNNVSVNGIKNTNYNTHQIIVYGYVYRGSRGNSFKYYPGYTARDYIALAGGTHETGSIFNMGNIRKIIIYRSDGTKINNAFNEIVVPGDIIEVPPNLLYQIVGRDGVMRTIASIISSTYLIYRFTID